MENTEFSHALFVYCLALTCKSLEFYLRHAAAVQKEIQSETDRVAGHTKKISPSPIHLSIYSPHGRHLWFIFKIPL